MMKKEFEELLEFKNRTPEADNRKPPIFTFLHRRIYELLDKVQDEKTIIDLWDQKIKYGRENEYGKSAFPKEEFLKPVLPEETNGDIRLINFVADAFEDFRLFWLEYSGCPDESNLKDLIPTRGWVNTNVLYRQHLEKVYSNFYSDYVASFKQEKKIVDFYSFMKLFSYYSRAVGYRVPITRSKFVTTRMSSPHVSGLMVEISEEDHSKDIDKYEKFVTDPKFDFFRNAAMRYGFFLDKNAPWRLIANIYSPAMAIYMEKYNILPGELFQKYFYMAEQHDLRVLKTILFNFYNSYVTAYPVFREPHGGLIERDVLTALELEQVPNSFWFEFMLQVKRVEETSKPFDGTKLRIILKKALDKEKYLDMESAISYINEVTKE